MRYPWSLLINLQIADEPWNCMMHIVWHIPPRTTWQYSNSLIVMKRTTSTYKSNHFLNSPMGNSAAAVAAKHTLQTIIFQVECVIVALHTHTLSSSSSAAVYYVVLAHTRQYVVYRERERERRWVRWLWEITWRGELVREAWPWTHTQLGIKSSIYLLPPRACFYNTPTRFSRCSTIVVVGGAGVQGLALSLSRRVKHLQGPSVQRVYI